MTKHLNACVSHALAWAFTTAIALASLTTNAAEMLFKATYEGEYSGWDIKMDRTLTVLDDGRYRFRSYAKNLFASLNETSLFTVEEGVIRPQEYRFERSVFGVSAVEAIDFDWAAGEARYTHSKKDHKNTTHQLDGNYLDPALYQLHIAADFYLGKRDVEYDFIKRNRKKQYRFKFIEEQSIRLGKRERPTLLVKRATDDEKETLIWLMPNLNYQAGQIRHQDEDGDTYEVQLAAYESNSGDLHAFFRTLQTPEVTKTQNDD